jgi:serine/threonine-protein kinase
MTPEEWGAIKALLGELGTLSPGEREARLRALPPAQAAIVRPFLDVDTGVVAFPAVPGVPETQREEVLAGRYRIERPLGRGGMGTVDLAHDLRLDCPVAIKRLRNLWLPDGEALRRLVHEARALAALDHPHVARVRDVIETSPPALVMEYVDGTTLSDWLASPRQAAAVLTVLRQVVEAVAYAHARGVVHCDLKPGNVLVTRGGDAKVVDFGIAQMQQTSVTLTGDTTVAPAFTPRYAAPEVKQGARPLPASDVYSLGVLVEEMVDDCARAGAPLPAHAAQALRRASAAALATEANGRPRDGAAFLALLPGAAPAGVDSWRTRAATALIVLGTCVSGGVAVTGDGGSASLSTASSGAPALAVVARVDDAAVGTVSAAAADLLRRSLGSFTQARLVTADVPAFKDDVETLVKELRFTGLTYVLVPSVSPSADGVRVSVAVRRASDGGVVHTVTASGAPDAMGAIVRRLSGQLREWLGEGGAPASAGPAYEPSARTLGEYSQARQYVERPDKPEALALARGLLERAVEREPEFAAAQAELARVLVLQYRERRDPALIVQAQAASGKAMRLDPGLVEARIAHATTLQATGQRADAIAELRQVVSLAPSNDRAMRLLGQLEAASGQVDEGVRTLRTVVERFPSWPNYRALGTVLFDAGRYAEAEQQYRECTALQPDNPFALQLLGAALQKQKKDAEAVRAYERALGIRPSAAAYTNLGTYQYGLGDLKAAERAYRKAVELRPQDALMQRNLSDALRAQGRAVDAREGYARAADLAEAEIRVNPQDQTALSIAAYTWARAGNCELSDAHSTRIESATSPQVDGLIDVANARLICGSTTRALANLEAIRTEGVDLSNVLEQDVAASAPREVRQIVARQLDPK